MPRIGCGIGIEKSGLSEIAEVERFVVLENVEIVVILVFKNDGVSDMNSRVLPF